MNGRGVFRSANGATYDGEFRNDQRCGTGHYVSANGEEYNGEWLDGKLHGTGSVRFANGDRYEGEFQTSMIAVSFLRKVAFWKNVRRRQFHF